MRVLLLGFFAAVGAVYAAGALYFFSHERTSQSLEVARALTPSELEHPEATLALIRDGMERRDFSPRVGALVARSREQVPSFYQPPTYQATYHATRLEEPETTREGFEAALLRFPANGRLHLDYARWLLLAPSVLPGAVEALDDAEAHMREALSLEPNLTPDALETLGRYGVPPERWTDIVSRRSRSPAIDGGGSRAGGSPGDCARASSTASRPNQRGALSASDRVLGSLLGRSGAGSRGSESLEVERGDIRARASRTGTPGRTRPPQAWGDGRGLRRVPYDLERRRAVVECRAETSFAGWAKSICACGASCSRRVFFAEATGYSPSYVRALLGLARVHARQRNQMEAILHYQKILQIDPEHQAAKDELVRVMARGER